MALWSPCDFLEYAIANASVTSAVSSSKVSLAYLTVILPPNSPFYRRCRLLHLKSKSCIPTGFLLTFTDANSASNLYYLIPEDITSHDFLLPTHCFRPCPNSYPTPFETWCYFCSISMLYLIVESRGQHGLHCSLIAPSFGQAGIVSGSSLLPLCTTASTTSFSLLLPLPLEGTSTLWSTTLKIEAWGTSLNGLALGLTKCERLLQY